MSSPTKIKKSDKENEFTGPSLKNAGKPHDPFFAIQPFSQKQPKKDILSQMNNTLLQSLKPMDVNTSFDEEIPENEGSFE